MDNTKNSKNNPRMGLIAFLMRILEEKNYTDCSVTMLVVEVDSVKQSLYLPLFQGREIVLENGSHFVYADPGLGSIEGWKKVAKLVNSTDIKTKGDLVNFSIFVRKFYKDLKRSLDQKAVDFDIHS